MKALKPIVYLSTFLLLLVSCGEEEVKKDEIFEIRNIGVLSTSEYTVGKVIKLDDEGEWYKWGDRKILISCKAKIKAGINLNNLRDEDIKVNGKRIEIYLPPAEITSFDMDPKDMKTEMVEVSGMRFDFTQEETNDILKQGEKAIRKEMKNLNILYDAEKNASVFVKDFYTQLGFEEVIVHASEEDKRDTDAGH